MQVRPPKLQLKLKFERLTVDSANDSQSGRINAYKCKAKCLETAQDWQSLFFPLRTNVIYLFLTLH
jgi:hypothetical protein